MSYLRNVSGRPRLALYLYQATSASGEEVPVMAMAMANPAVPHPAASLAQAVAAGPAQIAPGSRGLLLSR